MAQSTTIMAFRKRLKGLGYTDISICYDASVSAEQMRKIYVITAREPLAGEKVRKECCESEIYYLLR